MWSNSHGVTMPFHGLIPFCVNLVLVLIILPGLALGQRPPESELPEDYIVNVDENCGALGTNTTLLVKTDLYVRAHVICSGGYKFNFSTTDDVNFFAKAYFDGNERDRCVYIKAPDVDQYSVEVVVDIEEPGLESGVDRQARYTMTCTYDDNGIQVSGNNSIRDKYFSAKESQKLVGTVSNYSVSVVLTDVLGSPLVPEWIPVDKTIALKLYLDNSSSLLPSQNISVFPVSCEAVGGTNGKRHAILRSGCGDGVILNITEGFSMLPRVAISPYFRFFELETDKRLRLDCNYTVCTDCVGKNTCSGHANINEDIMRRFKDFIKSGNRLKRDTGGESVPVYPGSSALTGIDVSFVDTEVEIRKN